VAPRPRADIARGTVKPALAAAAAVRFTPLPGTTLGPDSSPNFSLKSPKVNVIFHGTNWTAANQDIVIRGVQSILSGPYLSALSQPKYGSDGKSVFGTSMSSPGKLDLDTPFAGGKYPSVASLAAFMKTVATGNDPNTVNVVVNDPPSTQGTVGYNVHVANGAQIYVGTRTSRGGSFDKDAFTTLFSHEIAEAMVAGVTVSDPGNFKAGNQVCDNEPEFKGYYFRLPGSYSNASGRSVPTTNQVQAYWSQKDGDFIVPTDRGPG
jgi:hypothetical protein